MLPCIDLCMFRFFIIRYRHLTFLIEDKSQLTVQTFKYSNIYFKYKYLIVKYDDKNSYKNLCFYLYEDMLHLYTSTSVLFLNKESYYTSSKSGRNIQFWTCGGENGFFKQPPLFYYFLNYFFFQYSNLLRLFIKPYEFCFVFFQMNSVIDQNMKEIKLFFKWLHASKLISLYFFDFKENDCFIFIVKKRYTSYEWWPRSKWYDSRK